MHLVCLPAEAELINREGFRVRFPLRSSGRFLDVDSLRLPASCPRDRLVQSIAAQKGMRLEALDEIVAIVDARLEANRRAR